MTIQKNVAGQRLHFLMVDSTDFATPEPGINTTNQYVKDNGAWSTCSNTESEINSGLYRITLAATETNAAVVTFKFTGAGCADQFLTFYPEAGYAAGISDLISNVSNVLSTLDDGVITTIGNKITSILIDTTSILVDTTSILVDTTTTLDDKIDSILADTTSILVDTGTTIDDKVDSILAKATSILTDTGTTLDDKIDSILVDTNSTLLNRTTSIVDYASQVLSTVDAAVVTTIGNKISSILVDTGTTLENRTVSILADTNTISNLGAGSDSAILSTLDGPLVTTIGNKITSILGDTTSILIDTTSILVDTADMQPHVDSIIVDTRTISNLGAVATSAILSTIDGPITNYLTSIVDDSSKLVSNVSNVISTLDNQLSEIDSALTLVLTDTGSTLQNQITSILVDTGTTLPASISDMDSALTVAQTAITAIKAKTDNLPSSVPKGVALPDFAFVMYSSIDHVTPQTGLTVTGYISKDGAAFAALGGTIAAIAYGVYQVDSISAAEMTADVVVLRFTATGADDVVIVIKTDS